MYSKYSERVEDSNTTHTGMNSRQRPPWQYDNTHGSGSQSGSLNNSHPKEHSEGTSQTGAGANSQHVNSRPLYSQIAGQDSLLYPYHRTTTGIQNATTETTSYESATRLWSTSGNQSSMGSNAAKCCSAPQRSTPTDVYSPTARSPSGTTGDASATKGYASATADTMMNDDTGQWDGRSEQQQQQQQYQKTGRLLNREQEDKPQLRLLLKDRNATSQENVDSLKGQQLEELMEVGRDQNPSPGGPLSNHQNNPADQTFSSVDWGRGDQGYSSSARNSQGMEATKGAGPTRHHPDQDQRVRSESETRGRNSGSDQLPTAQKINPEKKTLLEMTSQQERASFNGSKYETPIPPIIKNRDDVIADKEAARRGDTAAVHRAEVSRKANGYGGPDLAESGGHQQQGKKPRRDGSMQRERGEEGSSQAVIQLSEEAYNELLNGDKGHDPNQGHSGKCQGQGNANKGEESRSRGNTRDQEPMETTEENEHQRKTVGAQDVGSGGQHSYARNDQQHGESHGSGDLKGDERRGEDRDQLARRPLHGDRSTDLNDSSGGGSYQWDQYNSPEDKVAGNQTKDDVKDVNGEKRSKEQGRKENGTKSGEREEGGKDDEDTDDEIQYEKSEPKKPSEYKEKLSFIHDTCKKEIKEGLTIYQAELRKVFRDRRNKIRKFEFGWPSKSASEKVVMMVGSTGSGKSTMMNAMFNYMFGIQWTDDYRLKLIPDETKPGQVVNQAVSQTSEITAYTIHHQPWFTVPYTLTIIDTPGFGDTGGIKRDKQIMDQIRNFFKMKDSKGIDHLDVVGFVTQSSLPRLAPAQRYVFDSILSIFGKDVEKNIFMLLTFADGKKPQVLSGLKEANMNYEHFYKFNNSALYVGLNKMEEDDSDQEEDDEDDGDFEEMFWKMGANNFNKFMTDLESVQPQSLTLTAEVLEERYALETTMVSINENIKMGLRKLDQLKTEQEVLRHHEADIDKNKDFTYEVEEWVSDAIQLKDGKVATNCTNCHFTCHRRCKHFSVMTCSVFNWRKWGGECNGCVGKCPYSSHEQQPFYYKYQAVKVMKTSEELKRRYEQAEGKKLSAKQLIERCKIEFNQVQIKTLQLTQDARKCLARLDEIALKPNPLSTTDYIDLMIQEEEFMKEPGWKETVEQLKEVKKSARDLRSVTEEGFDPFAVDSKSSRKR